MRELDKVLDSGEKVLWEGKPQFLPFFFSGSLLMLFGLFWMMFLVIFIIAMGPFVLCLPHFWVGIAMLFGPPVYSGLVHKNMYYCITDKRVLIQKGLVGRDFEMVDFDKITNAEVNVNLFDKMFGENAGSILISTAGSFTYGRHGAVARPYRLSNITNPYEVFKFLKKVEHDVKTDIEYPNKLRPDTNPGYKTEYKPE